MSGAAQPSGQPSDEELMLRVGQGDQEAFAVLVRDYQQPLMNFFRRLGDYHHEEDLAQETFIRLYKYRNTYRVRARFRTFLYMLARRAHIDHLRKVSRRHDAMKRFEAACEVHLQAGRPADAVVEKSERLLGVLSEAMRTVVVMSVYEGFTYREIGEALGIPEGTVKSRVYHALARMKEAMSDEAAS